MHDAADFACILLGQYAQGVDGGVAVMHDQRLSGPARGTDMRSEPFTLSFRRILMLIVVEPRLADPDHSWMFRQVNKLIDLRLMYFRVFGVNTNRRKQV